MGFLDNLKKEKVPSELPDLAIEGPKNSSSERVENKPYIQNQPPQRFDSYPSRIEPPGKSNEKRFNIEEEKRDFDRSFDNLKNEREHFVFEVPDHLKENSKIEKKEEAEENLDDFSKESYFDKVLEDLNKDIENVSSIEDWYKDKIMSQDVVSNMKGYWEGNKTDMIIKGFGSEYKKKINKKIARLQELEMDWREVYFRLVKKEEEMKKEEKELKGILSEFVELCKRRREVDGEEKSQS